MSLSVLPADTLDEILAYLGTLDRFIMSRTCRAYSSLSTDNSQHACDDAIIGGYLDVLIYLRSIGMKLSGHSMQLAVAGNHLHCVKYLAYRGVRIYRLDVCIAVRKGYVDILKYFSTRGFSFSAKDVDTAVLNGHLHILRYLLEDRGVEMNQYYRIRAMTTNYAEIIEYLHNFGGFAIGHAWYNALRCGYVDVVRYLAGKKVVIPQYCESLILMVGNQEILDTLIAAGYL